MCKKNDKEHCIILTALCSIQKTTGFLCGDLISTRRQIGLMSDRDRLNGQVDSSITWVASGARGKHSPRGRVGWAALHQNKVIGWRH